MMHAVLLSFCLACAAHPWEQDDEDREVELEDYMRGWWEYYAGELRWDAEKDQYRKK